MNYRPFGKTNWQVSEIGCGMWGLADWTGSSDAESDEALDCAVENGCNFFDTAWAYGKGKSERILARLIKRHPEKKLYVATKIPPKNLKWPSKADYALDDCFPPEHIIEYAEKSLKNLEVPIDLLQFHVWEDGWARDHRWQDAVARLKRQGKIKAVGVSRQQVGARQLPRNDSDRNCGLCPGDLQHFRPGAQGQAVASVQGIRHRRDRARAVRRGHACGRGHASYHVPGE